MKWSSYGHQLGKNVRELRLMRGLSQKRLAELAGVSRNLISNLERNENGPLSTADPKLSSVYRIARALDVPPAVLLPGADRAVGRVCGRSSARVDLAWPETARDTGAFAGHYVLHGRPGEKPMFEIGAD